MIPDFDTFCTWMYVMVDDLWQELAPRFVRPGPAPVCSDSELITIALLSEVLGWDQETEALAHWRRRRDLFPHIPSQSRFNRRRRALQFGFNAIRQAILQRLDLAHDRQCMIDSLPVPVMGFHAVPRSTADWKAYGARFGRVASKKLTIFGYKLHVLMTLNGVILDFILAPANEADGTVGYQVLAEHPDRVVIGDKGYINAPEAAALATTTGTVVLTPARRNQRQQLPAHQHAVLGRLRQLIEVINAQLAGQFHIEQNHAHTFQGLCTRLYSKLTAHTLCIAINRAIGAPNVRHIKQLAFN